MTDVINHRDQERAARRRHSDHFLAKFGGDLIKVAIALLIAWFGVRERVTGLERDVSYTRASVERLEREVQYLRQRIDGVRSQVVTGGTNVQPIR